MAALRTWVGKLGKLRVAPMEPSQRPVAPVV